MVKGRRGAKADDKLVPVRSDRLRRNGVAGAVSADRLRLVDLQRDAPRHRLAPGDQRRDPELFVGEQLQIVERAWDDGRNDDGVDLGPVESFHAQKLRSEEHTSELQSILRISYTFFCLNKNKST